MAATSAAGPAPADFLEQERADMPRAGYVALAAAALLVAGNLLESLWAYRDIPHVYVIDALRSAAGESIGRSGLASDQVIYFSHQGFPLVLVGVIEALSWLAVGFILMFLLRAALHRGAAVPAPTRTLALAGVGATALATVGLRIAVVVSAHDFASSKDQSTDAAHDALSGASGVVAAHALASIGNLLLAGGFVLIALAAMRVGLLTRFLGVLGIIVGVLVVLSAFSGSSSFIVQALWLLLLGMMLLGRTRSGMPPAWRSGEAMPWPSQQELREARERARAEREGRIQEPAEPEAAPKRKRKRRR